MCVFFANKGRKDCFLIFWIGNNTFQTRKVKFKKRPKKSKFSNGLVHVFVKKSCFLLFLRRQKRCFFNIPDWKEYFLDQMNKVSKTSEKSKFSKGLVHVFVKKSCFLPRRKRSFFNIPDWKEYVLDKMNKASKISKESKFFKAVSPWLF